MHRRLLAVALVTSLVAVAVGGWFGWRLWEDTQRGGYERAIAALPAETLRATYTDWEQVRALADGASLAEKPSQGGVDDFVRRAYDLDLSTGSALVESTYAMADKLGVSPLDASWEAFGQSREGAVVVLRFEDAVDLDALEATLADLGYDAPAGGAGSGGVWKGTPDLVATIDPTLSPVFNNAVVLPDERTLLLSDAAAYVSSAAEVVAGSADGLADEAGVAPLTEQAAEPGEPVSAVLYASDFACEALSLASADEEDQERASQLVEEAGGVSPLAGMVMAMYEDRRLRVGMHFESSDQASDNLRPRTALAGGEAVGQGGAFSERFTIGLAKADGAEVVLDLEPVDAEQALLSDLSRGPVLFASC